MHQVDAFDGNVVGHDRLLVQDPARDVLVKTDGNNVTRETFKWVKGVWRKVKIPTGSRHRVSGIFMLSKKPM